jgi:hypothetical protein
VGCAACSESKCRHPALMMPTLTYVSKCLYVRPVLGPTREQSTIQNRLQQPRPNAIDFGSRTVAPTLTAHPQGRPPARRAFHVPLGTLGAGEDHFGDCPAFVSRRRRLEKPRHPPRRDQAETKNYAPLGGSSPLRAICSLRLLGVSGRHRFRFKTPLIRGHDDLDDLDDLDDYATMHRHTTSIAFCLAKTR